MDTDNGFATRCSGNGVRHNVAISWWWHTAGEFFATIPNRNVVVGNWARPNDACGHCWRSTWLKFWGIHGAGTQPQLAASNCKLLIMLIVATYHLHIHIYIYIKEFKYCTYVDMYLQLMYCMYIMCYLYVLICAFATLC